MTAEKINRPWPTGQIWTSTIFFYIYSAIDRGLIFEIPKRMISKHIKWNTIQMSKYINF